MSYATLRTMAPASASEAKEIQSVLPEIHSEQEREQFISSYKIVVIDNYARWCGPCKMIVEPLNYLFDKYHREGVFILLKENAEISLPNRRLTEKIRAVPCFHFYAQGNLVDTVLGADVNLVDQKISEVLNKYCSGC